MGLVIIETLLQVDQRRRRKCKVQMFIDFFNTTNIKFNKNQELITKVFIQMMSKEYKKNINHRQI